MTTATRPVIFSPLRLDGVGAPVVATGAYVITPTAAYDDGAGRVELIPFQVPVTAMAVTVDLPVTGPGWALKVVGTFPTISGTPLQTAEYVAIPAGSGTLQFEDLPRVDPATLSPAAAPEAAWWAALDGIGSEIDAKIGAAPTVVAAAAAAVAAAAAGLDIVVGNQERATKVLPGSPYTHAWTDANYRAALLARTDAQIVAPAGLTTPTLTATTEVVTPRAGQTVTAPGYLRVFVAPSGLISEDAIDERGKVPDWVLANWASRMGIPPRTLRIVPLGLTMPSDSVSTETISDAAVRLPILVPATTTRWRLHVRNYNDLTGVAFTGALAFRGAWIGLGGRDSVGALNGAWTSAPAQALTSFTTAADASEYVSGWVTSSAMQLKARTEHLLGLGFTCAAGQVNNKQLGGCWRSGVAADTEIVSPTTPLTRSQFAPFDIWLECEVDATVPLLYAQGDSLSVGTSSTLPVYDSWLNRSALAQGVWPWLHAQHGSNMTQWTSSSAWKFAKYVGMSRPDAMLTALGSNDIFGGAAFTALPDGQTRLVTLVATLRTVFGSQVPLYLASILPRNSHTVPQEALRVAYNDWLLSLPVGARNVFDFAATVANETDPSTLDARFVGGDGTHLLTAGYAREASEITVPMAYVNR